MISKRSRHAGILAAAIAASSCAALGGLGQIVQPPRFEEADGRPAEIRLMPPSANLPLGGAGVRMWIEVTNPNGFGFTLSNLNATLLLEGSRAASGDFPLGLPLRAGQETIVPLDLSVSFADLPDLAASLRQLTIGGSVPYALDGTVGVDAGRLGTPTFGPMRLTTGELRVGR
jgi:hypothetical protein